MTTNTTISHGSMRSSLRVAENRIATPSAIAGWWRAMLQRSQARRDARFLLGQPDHLLRDIGLARSEIAAVVRGATGVRAGKHHPMHSRSSSLPA